MKDSDNLKEMLEKFELPLKPGAWESIAPHIPVYPSKKKRFARFKLWGISIFVLLFGSAFLTYELLLNHKNIGTTSETKNSSVDGSVIAKASKVDEALNRQLYVSERYENISVKSETFKNTHAEVSDLLKKKPLKKRTVPTQGNDAHFKPGRSSSYKREFIPNTTNEIISPLSPEVGGLTLLLPHSILSGFSVSSADKQVRLLHQDHSIIQLKKERFYYLGLTFGNYYGQLFIDPQLMKLPKGKGQELALKLGRQMGKWNLSLGWNYTQMQQNFSMGDAHDTTYFKVFKPGFNTSLPSEYANRVHDTASLFIGGTHHNKVNQSFKSIGVSFNSAYTFYAGKRTGVFVAYGFNYRLLRKANTFFYDSVNKVAVPFTQSDKGIVYTNLFSSRLSIGAQYRINQRITLEIAPYLEQYHSPFIKHYYKVKMRNTGLNLSLHYNFNP